MPLWVEASALRVLVVGGGGVGTRRALWFHDAGATVRVVSLEFSRELVEASQRSPRLELVKMDARSPGVEEHVAWADLIVIAVPDEEARRRVWALARKYRKLVNDATSAEETQVVVPFTAEVYGGGIKIAVTSEGLSGVAARWARDRARQCLEADRELRTLFEVMWRVKRVAKELVPEPKRRVRLYLEVERLLAEGGALRQGVEAALELAARVVAERVGASPGAVLAALRGARRSAPAGR